MRIDHRLSDRNTIHGRYTNVQNHGDRPRGWAGGQTVNQIQSQYSTAQQFLFGYTSVIAPTVVNDLKLSYLRGNYSILFAPPWNTQNWSADLGLPSGIPYGVPYFNFTGQGMFGLGATGGPKNDIE